MAITVSRPKLKGCNMGQLEEKWEGEYAYVLEEFDQICHDGYHLNGKKETRVTCLPNGKFYPKPAECDRNRDSAIDLGMFKATAHLRVITTGFMTAFGIFFIAVGIIFRIMVMKKRKPIPRRSYPRDVPEPVVISNSKMSLKVERAPSSKEITRHDWKWSKLLSTIIP